VKKTFAVVYTVAGMTDSLKRLDYVYKKPTLTPGQHPDVAIQQAFIEGYQKLKEGKGKEDPIDFMDGVHPRHNPVAAYGWIKRGTDNTMESNTGRSRVNLNGAVDGGCYLSVAGNRHQAARLGRDWLGLGRLSTTLVAIGAWAAGVPGLSLRVRPAGLRLEPMSGGLG